MEERATFLIAYAAAHHPVTVRQLYYRAEVEGLSGIDKTEGSYIKIQRQVLQLRREGRMPYGHIADATRWMRSPRTFDSVEAALQNTAQTYRKALWNDTSVNVEIWCEKDALAGVLYPVTGKYDVPLMVTRGFSSETFCFEAIAAYTDHDRPLIIYYLGDFDRSGRDAANALQEKLERFASEVGLEVEFNQLAISDMDILDYDADTKEVEIGVVIGNCVYGRWLPTREHKRKCPADRQWPHAYACELDAIEPDDLRNMVRAAIEVYLPGDQLRVLQIAEASERRMIKGFVGMLANRAEEDEDHEGKAEVDELATPERPPPMATSRNFTDVGNG
jgi:hypothetical protein